MRLEQDQNEREVSIVTILVFLALMAGIMLGYGWCWYHLGG